MNIVDGKMFRAMLSSGALDLQRHCDEVNSLNVFPVPDGDTGLNMLSTLKGGVEAVMACPHEGIGDIAKALSRGMLLAARGNSGVILSQFFAGLADGLSSYESINVLQFAQAFEAGVKRAYEVVVQPVEGTILTVMREGGHKAMECVESTMSFEEYFTVLLANMKQTLLSTPDLLPVLKDAGVIDSGGAGLLYIIEGMAQAIGGKIIEDVSLDLNLRHDGSSSLGFEGFDENTDLDYGYCTEFILQLSNAKGGVEAFDLDAMIHYFETFGDSLVAFREGTLVKVHVHTKEPAKAIEYANRFGEFVRFKMENMTLQHHQTLIEKSRNIGMMARPAASKLKMAIVAVCPNKETAEIFQNYGAGTILDGGEFLNPGTNDFLEALKNANAEDVFVLLNNKNEKMVCELAAGIYVDSRVHIIPSDNLAEGLSALSVMNLASLTVEENIDVAMAALHKSTTVGFVKAGKDSHIGGLDIHKGEFFAISNGNIVCKGDSRLSVFKAWLDRKQGEDHSLLMLLLSSEVTAKDREDFVLAANEYDDFMDVQELEGGRMIVDFYAILD